MTELIELLALFVLILILLRKKVSFGVVMIIATILLGVLSQFSPALFLKVTLTALTNRTTIILLVFLYMVSLLEKIIRQSGKLDRMIAAMERFIPGRRLRLVLMPAFLGFLASPGGAMFSAPFVEKASETLNLTGEQKTFINYWFRHIWKGFLPLYPATVLAANILEVPVEAFIVRMFPMTLAAIAGGVIFGLVPLKLREHKGKTEKPRGMFLHLLEGIFPVAAILVLVIAFKVNMALALFSVVAVEFLSSRLPLHSLPGLMTKSMNFSIFLSVTAILIFKEALKESSITVGFSTYLSHLGIPLTVLFFLLPFLVSFLTGITQASVGITFPLLLGMAALPGSINLFCFAFEAAVIGILLSPTHLCLILTADYFGIDFTRVYRHMALPAALMLIMAIVIYAW